MKVSIITPAYNSGNYILKTYESIKNQTYIDWEWLVTDDRSTDNTLMILNELAKKDSRVRVYSNSENSGAAVSRNNSLTHASGKFIAFIDSDDVWLPNKLEQQIEFMSEDIAFSFTAYELIDSDGNALNRTVDTSQKGCFTYNDMLRKSATLGCSTVMLRRDCFDEISMPLIRTGQDYALWLKLLKTGHNAYVLNKVFTQYRILPDSISRNKVRKAIRQWEIYRKIEKLDLLSSSVNFCFYAFRAIFRKC
ncbi:putative teichuronic acid biosynthesis glycosyltransferase TuaG [Vibrio chagasii]|nr:putative teichuronic acid biosynthesis glycosyltransferase TuaG [Vibrio chagasii]CAH7099677.1 putative teichuronic acid biosynthesis glycosyltransferase TuaG [Vibrio chagasii]CAH7413120.1 putative teichuronic acid biosynthesis glycosyltransferase TuaG [Vibrio chagasii]CAH7474615.1 putative teichuronic acid biosynthesis glycosyltransferase TuaG [Vibrio chagasii]